MSRRASAAATLCAGALAFVVRKRRVVWSCPCTGSSLAASPCCFGRPASALWQTSVAVASYARACASAVRSDASSRAAPSPAASALRVSVAVALCAPLHANEVMRTPELCSGCVLNHGRHAEAPCCRHVVRRSTCQRRLRQCALASGVPSRSPILASMPPPHQVSTGVCKRHSARHAFLGSTPNDGRFAVGLGRRRVVRRSAYQRRPMRRAADRCAFGWLPSFCARVRMSSSPGATCFASCAFIQLRSSDGRPLPLPRPASERVPASPGAASTRAALSIAALSWQASAAASLCALASHCHRCVVHLSVRQRCHRAAPSRVVHSVAAVLRQAPDAVTLCVHHHRCSSSCCVRYRRRGLPAPWLIKLRAPPSPQVMPPLHLRRCGSSSCVCRHCRSLSRCVRHYRRGPCHRLPCQCGSPSCCACSASAAAPATAWRSTAL